MMKSKDYGKAMRSSGNTKGINGLQGRTPMDVGQRQNEMANSFGRFSAQTAENMYGDPSAGYGQGGSGQYAPGLDSYMSMKRSKELESQSPGSQTGENRANFVKSINDYKRTKMNNSR